MQSTNNKVTISILKAFKWDDDGASPVTVRVDKNGFYIYWVCQNGETGLQEISSIRDTRTGKYARVPSAAKLRTMINLSGSNDSLEDRQVQIFFGSEFQNLREINFSCLTKEVAKVWADELMKLANDINAINACPLTFLRKTHAKLRFMVEKGDVLPVKRLIKMFTNSKEERRRIERALEQSNLPSSKNDTILIDDLTFEKFLLFYKHLVGRNELVQIFDKLFPKAELIKENNQTTVKCIDVDTFVNFLNKTQRDPRLNEILYKHTDKIRGLDIIKQFEPHKEVLKRDMLSYDGFMRFLMSDDNSIVAREKLDLNMDMDQPLNHYFINSSHNTYLTGHQLRGKSSVEMYRQCLLAGCRCVELDCWDGKNPEEPIITHGYTVVTEISFKQTLEAINESAFKTSPYPVILSFENHCSMRQQAKMVQYCKEIFSEDVLLTEPLADFPLDQDVPLPSPNRLKYRIIIKNKKKKEKKHSNQPKSFIQSSNATVASCDNEDFDESEPEDEELTSAVGTAESLLSVASDTTISTATITEATAPNRTSTTTNTSSGVSTNYSTSASASTNSVSTNSNAVATATASAGNSATPSDDSSSQNDQITPNSDTNSYSSNSKSHEIVEGNVSVDGSANIAECGPAEAEPAVEMSELVVYMQPVRFKSFEEAEARGNCFEVTSFAETQAYNLLKERPIDFVSMNKRQFTRIYPRGTRVDSSNYIPQLYWNAGCQMVALNYQTLDLGMQLNMGIFDYNNRSGYLLKPEFMRRADRLFNPSTETTVDGIIAGTVSIQVISGQFLSEKCVGTFVEVEMYGLKADMNFPHQYTKARRWRTKVSPANGINPIYDEKPFLFEKVVLPDLATIRIAAYEEGGKFIGYRILPVTALQPGYRHLPLRSESNQSLTLPTLFLKIEVNSYVPDLLLEFADALANPIDAELKKREKQLEANNELV